MKTKLLSITAAFALSINAFAQIPTNGLVAYYQFNGNANDLSGNNNNGTVNGATLVTDRNGNTNSAYSFNGSTSYINIPHSSTLTFTSNAISISFWAKIISVPSSGYNGIIVSKQAGSGTSQQGFNVFGNTAQTVGLSVSNGGGNFGGDNNYAVSLNQYHHFVYIYDNGNGIAYLDGIQAGGVLSQTATIGANTMDLLIGKANWSNINAPNFNGVIDEMQIYDRGLTPTEVTQIYSGVCSTVDITTGLVAQYDFTGNANDLSGNSLNGTVTGAVLTSDRFGNANSAYSFNGSTDNISINTNSILDFQTANKFSISYWINPTTLSATQTSVILNKQIGSGSSQDGWNSNIDVDFSTNFRIQNGTSTSACAFGSSPSTIGINQDYHIVQTYDNGISTVYINGVLFSQVNCTALIGDNSSVMLIGKATWTFSNTKGFNGKIDDIRIYNRALSSCDIDSLFSMPSPCTGIISSITANGPVTFCQGGNVILTSSAATSYLWSNNATTQSITVSSPGANTVTTINSNGCSATSAVTTVTINPKPIVVTTNPSAVCSPATVDITMPAITTGSTGGLTYSYFTNAGATTPYLTPTVATSGSYYIVGATGNSCSDTTAVTVTVNPLPTVSFNSIPNFININASPIVLTGTPTGGTFTGSGVSSNNFTPLIAGLGTSHITYNYTNNNACSNSSVTSTIVYDTTGILCTSYDTVYTSVTDTLIINAVLTGVNPPNNINAVTIYPNPASTHITIDNGNYNSMAGYTLKIENNLGQTVFTSLINQQQFYIDLSTWSGNGIYFVHIIDAQSNTIEIKKIVLQ